MLVLIGLFFLQPYASLSSVGNGRVILPRLILSPPILPPPKENVYSIIKAGQNGDDVYELAKQHLARTGNTAREM